MESGLIDQRASTDSAERDGADAIDAATDAEQTRREAEAARQLERASAIATTMHLFGAPSRVRILHRLALGACSVNELARALGMERAAVSKQLRLLSDECLVAGKRRGQQVIYSIPDERLVMMISELMSRAEELATTARTVQREIAAAERAERLHRLRLLDPAVAARRRFAR
jgi:DNA-binding transcriptional ArsR family regulator